jgi:hypothetical protein
MEKSQHQNQTTRGTESSRRCAMTRAELEALARLVAPLVVQQLANALGAAQLRRRLATHRPLCYAEAL